MLKAFAFDEKLNKQKKTMNEKSVYLSIWKEKRISHD